MGFGTEGASGNDVSVRRPRGDGMICPICNEARDAPGHLHSHDTRQKNKRGRPRPSAPQPPARPPAALAPRSSTLVLCLCEISTAKLKRCIKQGKADIKLYKSATTQPNGPAGTGSLVTGVLTDQFSTYVNLRRTLRASESTNNSNLLPVGYQRVRFGAALEVRRRSNNRAARGAVGGGPALGVSTNLSLSGLMAHSVIEQKPARASVICRARLDNAETPPAPPAPPPTR
ncbi:hypothetical protein EVAR_36941_1 [Eumeta japonica]|uniref:Uncharacterized protein n=1 Tax=Eumeta variegata TaxID=151549 RepID=A0A4C1X7Y8_EUMVA|nr:hypothetical protein EVAR_36941_1 [Eumeta japonica]